MGARIAAAAAASGCFEIVGVADVDPDRADLLAGRFGAVSAADISTMLASSGAEAVYLGLPPTFNRAACEAAAIADVHVMVDKPIATTPADGAAIATLAARSSKAWMVGFSYRFRAEWQQARSILTSGRLGAATTVTDVIIESAPTTPAWYWTTDLGGGVLNLQSHHCFDRIAWLLDSDVAEVTASTWTLRSGSDTSAQILTRYDSGTTGVISLAFGRNYSDDPRTLLVVQCERGMVQIDADRSLRVTDTASTVVTSFADDDWLTREIAAFAAGIADPLSACPSVTDGLRALACASAAAESDRTRSWVKPVRIDPAT